MRIPQIHWCASVGVAVGLVTWFAWPWVILLTEPRLENWWFDSDVPWTYLAVATRWTSRHARSAIHPLWPYLTTLPAAVLQYAGISVETSVRSVVVLSACLWGTCLSLATRAVIADGRTTLVVVGLACLTSAALAWVPLVETWALGSSSILLCVYVASRPRRSATLTGAATAFAFGVTVTNVASAVVLLWQVRSWRSRALACCAATTVIGVGTLALPLWLPSAGTLLQSDESRYLLRPSLDYPARIVVGPVVFSDAASAVRDGMPALSFVGSMPSGALSITAATLWACCVAVAAWGWWRQRRILTPMEQVLVWSIAAQVALHAVYGPETFLYALHLSPLLVIAVARGLMFTMPPRAVTPILCALVMVVGASNVLSLRGYVAKTRAHAESIGVSADTHDVSDIVQR